MIKIRAFINGWNGRCQPFVWIKTAEEILTKPTVKQLQLRPTRIFGLESGIYPAPFLTEKV
jgi:hypothetical protein